MSKYIHPPACVLGRTMRQANFDKSILFRVSLSMSNFLKTKNTYVKLILEPILRGRYENEYIG